MDYYERYWQRQIGENGIATQPPEWKEGVINRMLSITKPYCQGNVLDVGCGEGTFTYQLSKLSNVKKIIGTDISNTAISKARKKYPAIDFKTASITNLPFQDKIFDFIAMVELAEHILDTELMLKEINRVLKPGGFILITTTDFNFLKKIIIAGCFWEKYFYPTNPHMRFFDRATLKDVLEKTGFKIIEYKWNGSYLGLMPKGQVVIAKKIMENILE